MTIRRIGDPHLGRRFINGVPLHRRGEREMHVNAKFIESLSNLALIERVVIMGDLFDKFVVPPEVELFAYNHIKRAAENHPDVKFVIIRGNHDASRNVGSKSSFDVLEELLAPINNVYVIKDPDIIDGHGFVPWDPFVTAEEQVKILGEIEAEFPLESVNGHWDVQSFGDDKHNLIPVLELMKLTKEVYTGHIHKPTMICQPGLTIHVVGSMLPYAHGEDSDDSDNPKFVTMTLEELNAVEDLNTLRDKCLRVKLRPGESTPEYLNVLQLTTMRLTDSSEDASQPDQVEMGEFDFLTIFKEEMEKENVSLDTQTEILDSYQGMKGV